MIFSASNRIVLVDENMSVAFDRARSEEGTFESAGKRQINFNVRESVEALINEPDNAAMLLNTGNKQLVYVGDHSASRINGRTLGATQNRNAGHAVFEGDNVLGEYFMSVREALRNELATREVPENPVPRDTVISDYTPEGEFKTAVEALEEEGVEFVHTDVYRPVVFRHDANRAGTTGHAERRTAGDTAFESFVCPFGLDKSSSVQVGSAAEVSLYYEKALRGDLDWKSLMDDLRVRGLNSRTKAAEEKTIEILSGQFDWMREQIAENDGLRNMKIVASSMLIPDGSMGRSVYDEKFAPSPAHILARYIHNPVLLYSSSENSVLRALSDPDKQEMDKFTFRGDDESINIVIVGSDTIGGRVPGTRADKRRVSRPKVDAHGRPVLGVNGRQLTEYYYENVLQFKPEIEVQQDYAAFAARLDDIIGDIPQGVKVNFLTAEGAGTPGMVQKYVRERGGSVYKWDFTNANATVVGREGGEHVSVVRYSRFNEILPVLAGARDSVDFYLDDESRINDEISRQDLTGEESSNGERRGKIHFSSADAPEVGGGICYSITKDRSNARLLRQGSLLMSAGVPVVHVMENCLESEQNQMLRDEALVTLASFNGELPYDKSLFNGDIRQNWDMNDSLVMSNFSEDRSLAVPMVYQQENYPVNVAGYSFNTVFGAYAASVLSGLDLASQDNLRALAAAEGSMLESNAAFEKALNGVVVSPELQEKSLRTAVHLMAQTNAAFANRLVDTGAAEIVLPATIGDTSLFVGPDGQGENRFGVVLMAERDFINGVRQAAVERAEAENRKQIEDARRLQKRLDNKKAAAFKTENGFPEDVEASKDAVWFLGTNRPDNLRIGDDVSYFEHWNEDRGSDPLTREKAGRERVACEDDSLENNNFVYISGTNLAVSSGRKPVFGSSNSRDLSGVKRVDPKTGEEFVCGFGIPVKKNADNYEYVNNYNMPASFLSDNDVSSLINSIVSTDAAARSTAIEHDMGLCLATDESRSGMIMSMSRVFKKEVYSSLRHTRQEIEDKAKANAQKYGTTFNDEFRKLENQIDTPVYVKDPISHKVVVKSDWHENPHHAPACDAALTRYYNILKLGTDFPLNCIGLPDTNYTSINQDPAAQKAVEAKFLGDLNMALGMMNATAIAMGVPMKFPLDKDGHYDLGPDIPDNLRAIAENRIDSFIGVVKKEDLITGKLPVFDRIPLYKAQSNGPLSSNGMVFTMRPNELLGAFGRYDFRNIISVFTAVGSLSDESEVKTKVQMAPMHEMAFRMEDGTLLSIYDNNFTNRLPVGEVNKFLRYEKNSECRFRVKCSDPEKTAEAVNCIRSYVEKASQIKIETRLLREGEKGSENLGMEGFINLLSSNSKELGDGEYDVAPRSYDAITLNNRFDGTDSKGNTGDSMGEYYGAVDAGDGFTGFVQYRYTLPDGTQSAWLPVKDKEIRTDITMNLVNRTYGTDERKVLPMAVLETALRSEAIVHSGEKFRLCDSAVVEQKVDDKVEHATEKKIEDVKVPEAVPVVAEQKESEKKESRIMVSYYGSKTIPDDAILVQISNTAPKGFEPDFCFKSMYPDYRTMVESHKSKEIDDAEYARRYVEKVLEPNKEKILNGIETIKEESEGKDIVLLCFERPGEFCHRYLVNNFLNENGIACQENPMDKKFYHEGKIALYGEEGYKSGEKLLGVRERKNEINVFSGSKENADLSNFSERTFNAEVKRPKVKPSLG